MNSINRRKFLKSLSIGGIALILPSTAFSCSVTKKKPNIIFILSDDVSYRDFSATGQTEFTTLNIDRLADEGIMFNNAYSGAPECAPSRASLMTGKHMGHCRIRANRSVRGQDHLLKDDITIAEVLKKVGYKTGFVGKWGIGLPGTEGVPHKKGFDYSYGFYDQSRAHTFYPDYVMENGKKIELPNNHGFNMDRVYKYNGRPVDDIEDVKNNYKNGKLMADGVIDPSKVNNSEDLFQAMALKFIKDNKENPFFLYYATQLPHGPVITPDLGEYKEKEWSLTNKEWAAMMKHMDEGVGKILDLLEEKEILDNTIIFFAGDNGYSQYGYFGRKPWEDDPLFNNKGPWPKGKFTSTHEGGLRIPLFVYWKGKIKHSKSDHICTLYDFFPTAAELAGVESTETDGISFLPTIDGNSSRQQKHKYLYWENGTWSRHAQSVRIKDWWAFRSHPENPVELYDLINDSQCKNDLSGDYPEVIKKVKATFTEAHTDSEWYVNPGESKSEIETKEKKAESEGSLQIPIRANSTYTRK